MRRSAPALLLVVLAVALASLASQTAQAAIVYQGALQTNDTGFALPTGFSDNGELNVGKGSGINPNQAWTGGTLYWTVSNNSSESGYSASTPWHYAYTFHRANGNVDANVATLLIETLGGFVLSSTDLTPSGFTQQTAHNGDTLGAKLTNLPASLACLTKTFSEGTSITLEFWSSWAPVWGDFYAQAGVIGNPSQAKGYAYNNGFAASDSDPAVAASSGSVSDHTLVPGIAPVSVPEPASLMLFGALSLPALLLVRRRYR